MCHSETMCTGFMNENLRGSKVPPTITARNLPPPTHTHTGVFTQPQNICHLRSCWLPPATAFVAHHHVFATLPI